MTRWFRLFTAFGRVSAQHPTSSLRALSTMPPLASPEDAQLISDLIALSRKSPKLVKSSVHPAPADPKIPVRSWKMNEFKYYDVPSPFPTLARGLFSTEIEPGNHRIVARGYDKFFNIGEVPWTRWDSLKSHTEPPYTLSLKSNGCIIFIAALTASKLLVTSKHSIGHIEGVAESHAEAGTRWLKVHLESRGKTMEELAAALWEKNLTAVAELCDDSFEEHVLPYPPEKSGLHLHGLNHSIKTFHTLLPPEVDAFADEWGFIKTPTISINSIDEVKTFTDEIAESGKWNGEALEGFVVRTHVADSHDDYRQKDRPPYPPGSTFFFKVKFDEPYMMYRDWREVTKVLLSAKGSMSTIPKSKLKRPETLLYAKWVNEEIKRNRSAFDNYNKGKGIIETRERFLAWMEGKEGKKKQKELEEENVSTKSRKTIILPIAVPGCGKTSTSVALAHLFGFAHTQSDDVKVKKRRKPFLENVTKLLESHDVVIADKVNLLHEHRSDLRIAASAQKPPARLLALDWSDSIASLPQLQVHRICSDRILQRGDAHQSLLADTSAARAHEEVVLKFLRIMEELNAGEVDDCVDMNVESDMEGAIRSAINGIVPLLGLKMPSEEKIKDAIAASKRYAPTPTENKKAKDAARPRYFGFLPDIDLGEMVGSALAKATNEEGNKFWEHLKETNRVTPRPHMTVVHKNTLKEESELWDRCSHLQQLDVSPSFRFRFGSLLWNDRVMAVTVDKVESDDSQEGGKFVADIPRDVMNRLHMTVGTRDDKIPPVEAKAMVENWRIGEVDGLRSIELGDLEGRGILKGLY